MQKFLVLGGWAVVIVISSIGYSIAANEKQSIEKNDKQKVEKKETANELVTKGNQAFIAKRYDDAIDFYKQAIAVNPRSIDAHYDLAISYEKKGMLDESIEAYKHVIKIDPTHAQAHNNLGIIYENKKLFEEALSEYKKAVAQNPNLAPAQFNLGRAYLNGGLNDTAAEHLYKAGVLFLERRDRRWAISSYSLLKKTKSEKMAKELYEKLYPDKVKEK